MTARVSRIDTGMGVSFTVSAVIHVAVFLLLMWWGKLFPAQMAIQETYYVDVVTLPVANPQLGSPTPATGRADSASPPAPVTQAPMAIPTPQKPASKGAVKSAKSTAPQNTAESESAFAERMANLERNSEAQHEAAVLEKLQNKIKNGAQRTGMPNAVGTEAGSRYGDYIKSRLEDALKLTSSYSTKKPEVAVRLTIAADGKLSRVKIERSSGDATFELAVRRAIDLASEKFTAPPNHSVFENGFVFRPKSISSSTSR